MIGYYGYPGDNSWDHNSLKGIGNSPATREPGSLIPLYDAALKKSEAIRRGLHPRPDGTPSDEEFQEGGKTYRWSDTVPDYSPVKEGYVDVYNPEHPPDSGISSNQYASNRAYMVEHNPRFKDGLPNPVEPPPGKNTFVGTPPPPTQRATRIGSTFPEEEEEPLAAPTEPQAPGEPNAGEPNAGEPTTEPPLGAVKQKPVTEEQIAQTETNAAADPDLQAELAKTKSEEKKQAKIYDAQQQAVRAQHSQALEPQDLRVAERINPDTGSQRVVGQYFVEGDPYHARLLRGQAPEDLAKLPTISQAISRGDPFHYIYSSAEPEYEEEPPTQESRQFEYQQSPAALRLLAKKGLLQEGEQPPTIDQHVSMIPMQLVTTKDTPDVAPDVLLEGFGLQQMMNNGGHLWRGARQAGIDTPYTGPEDPMLARDVLGFMHNQKNGFRGDGSQMLDENGQPHPLWKENQAKAVPYVPHMLDRPRAEFIHAMMNIRPGGPKAPTKPPGFSERAAWQRRVNEGYFGQLAGTNKLLEELDRKLPQVQKRKWVWNGKTQQFETKFGKSVPWSEGTLERTWRKYHLPLMGQLGMPAIGTKSIRETGAPAHVLIPHAPVFKQVAAQYEPHRPAPISENPEVGAPAGGANAPGQPGLLEQPMEQPSTVSTPALSQYPTFEAYSPNMRDNMSFRTAKLALNRPEHQKLADFSDRLENDVTNRYRYAPAKSKNVVGDWADAAENSRMSEARNQHPQVRKLVQAIKGLHGAQKQVVSFRHDPEGPHQYYRLAFNTDDPEQVRQLLDKQDLQYRTLELPDKKGQSVVAHIIDTSPKNVAYKRLEPLFKKGYIVDSEGRPGHAEFIGDQRGISRDTARDEYERILGEAQKAWDESTPGAGGPFDRAADEPEGTAPWWKPYADEARENFLALQKSDPYQQEAKRIDHQEAVAYRMANRKPAKTRELKGLRAIAEEYVKQNPIPHNLAGHQIISEHEKFPDWVKTKEDIAEYYRQRNRKLDYSKPEDRQEAIDAFTDDAMREIAGGSEAPGWYSETVDLAHKHVGDNIAKEILTNPKDKLAYDLATAIASQGQEVTPNYISGYLAYRYWKKYGKFPLDPAIFKGGGKAVGAMVENFRKLNDMWKDAGADPEKSMTLKQFQKFLETPFTMQQLRDDYNTDISGENADYTMEGSGMLGPKIGSFFNNLNKRLHTTTFDLWNSRSLNRMAGDMFKFSDSAFRGGTRKKAEPPHLDALEGYIKNNNLPGKAEASPEEKQAMLQEIDALRKAAPAGELTRENAMPLAPTILNWADRTHKLLAKADETGKTFLDKTPQNMLAKNIDENFHGLSDAPRHGTERKYWRMIYDGLVNKLGSLGIKMTHGDAQALEWWMEQKLFMKAGARATPPADYLDAAHTLVRLVKTGFLPKLHEEDLEPEAKAA